MARDFRRSIVAEFLLLFIMWMIIKERMFPVIPIVDMKVPITPCTTKKNLSRLSSLSRFQFLTIYVILARWFLIMFTPSFEIKRHFRTNCSPILLLISSENQKVPFEENKLYSKEWIKGSLVNLFCEAKPVSKQDVLITVTWSVTLLAIIDKKNVNILNLKCEMLDYQF